MCNSPIRRATRLALGPLLACAAAAASAQVVLVAGAKSPIAPLTSDQASALYLGNTNRLPSGATALLIDQPEASPAREAFYSKVTGKTPAQVKAVWTRLVFSGRAQLPKEAANDDDVKKRLEADPSAIGYIEKQDVDAGVKVLLSVE
jgi:ABC-type phosphate transport system substrate-binding protein